MKTGENMENIDRMIMQDQPWRGKKQIEGFNYLMLYPNHLSTNEKWKD